VQKITPAGAVIGVAGTGCNCVGGWGLNVGPGLDSATNVYAATGAYLWKVSPAGSVDLFAGGNSISDGPSLLAGFFALQDAAVDALTNIILSDTTRIRKIRPDGWVSTMAGTGFTGYANGRGAVAQFNNAAGMCVDTNGNVYVADSGNNRIRVVWTDTCGIGIPDSWQRLHFGYIGIDPSGDADHDGMNNYAEFASGTDPNDPNSVFKIVTASIGGVNTQISWNSVLGRNYGVQYSYDLLSWTLAGGVIPGNGMVASFTDQASAQPVGPKFYRVYIFN